MVDNFPPYIRPFPPLLKYFKYTVSYLSYLFQTPAINADKNSLEFSAHGTGANVGRNEYYFKFVFFKEINPVSNFSFL